MLREMRERLKTGILFNNMRRRRKDGCGEGEGSRSDIQWRVVTTLCVCVYTLVTMLSLQV